MLIKMYIQELILLLPTTGFSQKDLNSNLNETFYVWLNFLL